MLCHRDYIVKYLLIAAVLVCGSAAFVMAQLAVNLPRRAAPRCAVLFFLCWVIISIFSHFIQFLETAAGGEVDRMFIFISFFHLFAGSAKHLVGQHLRLLAGPARRFSSPPASRGGRPVSAETIGKQNPKMYFLVSSSSLTSKHSKRARKNIVDPQFLLTMISIAVAPRFPPLKFDKTKKL